MKKKKGSRKREPRAGDIRRKRNVGDGIARQKKKGSL
jgi:hypothetical protein